MKNVLFLIGKSLLRQFLQAPVAAGGVAIAGNTLMEPVRHMVHDAVKKYAFLAGLSFLFAIYFVAGTVLMLAGTAQAFDTLGRFAFNTLFYSGAGVTILSLAVLGGCYWSFRKGSHRDREDAAKVAFEVSPLHQVAGAGFPFLHLVEPVLSGVIAGLVSRKVAKDEVAAARERRRRFL